MKKQCGNYMSRSFKPDPMMTSTDDEPDPKQEIEQMANFTPRISTRGAAAMRAACDIWLLNHGQTVNGFREQIQAEIRLFKAGKR